MKKVLVALVLALALVTNCVALASCGKKNGSGDIQDGADFTADGLSYNGEAVEITFYHTMGENLSTVLDKYVAKFNEIYPNITVKHSQEGGYDDVRDKISTELSVGNQPNIAYCYPDHVALYNLAGAVVSLDSLIDSPELGFTAEQKADFIEGYYNEGKQFGDGKMYTLPMSKSTEVLYYNKTFFDEHNISVPTTWDELEAVCKQIKEIDPNCIPLGYDSEANWFITMCEQLKSPYTSAEEGNHFLFDNETNRAFVKRFSEWYVNEYVTTQEIHGSYTSALFTAVGADDQRSYMSIGSSAGATHQRPKADSSTGEYPFEVGIATVPQMDSSNRKVISQGPSLCIFTGTDLEVVASWLFVKYITTSVDFQAEFGMASGYVPVLKSVSDNEAYKAFIDSADGGDNIAALSAKVCLEQSDAYYTSPAFNGSSTARDQVGALLQKCMVYYKDAADKDKMIADAFAAAVEECEYMS